jgi:hypothetical protein
MYRVRYKRVTGEVVNIIDKPTEQEAIDLIMKRYGWRICLHGRNEIRVCHKNKIIRRYPVVGQS